MIHINYLAIVTAAISIFIVSSVYYVLLNTKYMKLLGNKPDKDGRFKVSLTPNRVLVELVRNFVLALVIAYAVSLLNLLYWNQALLLAIWLWIGFPVVMLVGMVSHENYSKGLAVIHAGDWLLKIVIIAIVVTLWQ